MAEGIEGLGRIKAGVQGDEQSLASAQAEAALIAAGNYEPFDAKDNYELRKKVKTAFLAKLPWVVNLALGFTVSCVLMLTFAMGVYMSRVMENQVELGKLLDGLLTHTAVLVLGVCGRFLFPKKGG